MTERGRSALWRNAEHFAVGQSHMHWDGSELTLDLVERAVPHLTPVRGRIRLIPDQLTERPHTLAPKHYWWPHAPSARIEVDLERPDLSWQGDGYLDQNWGDEPIEDGFSRWDWLRAEGMSGGAGAVLYAGERRNGSPFALGMRFPGDGSCEEIEVPPTRGLKPGFWGVGRSIPVATEAEPKILKTFEDSPFYMRSHVETEIGGEAVHAMHESLDLDRFSSRVVKLMLPFRMPRIR
ncbi:MAG: hydratase [Pseudomonadota bacterium]